MAKLLIKLNLLIKVKKDKIAKNSTTVSTEERQPESVKVNDDNWQIPQSPLVVRMILLALFDQLEDHFSYKEVQFKKLSLSMKNSCPPAKNVAATLGLNAKILHIAFRGTQYTLNHQSVKIQSCTLNEICWLKIRTLIKSYL